MSYLDHKAELRKLFLPPVQCATGHIIIDSDTGAFIALRDWPGSSVGTFSSREEAVAALRRCGIVLAPIQGGVK
jgi:hypothetical protein